MNSKPVHLNASGQWNLCISLVCCEEMEQCDLLAVPSSPWVPARFVDVPAASSNFLSQASKPNSIFSWKKLGRMLVWTKRASPSQQAKCNKHKKELLSQASSVSASTFRYLFGKVRIILCLKLSINLRCLWGGQCSIFCPSCSSSCLSGPCIFLVHGVSNEFSLTFSSLLLWSWILLSCWAEVGFSVVETGKTKLL